MAGETPTSTQLRNGLSAKPGAWTMPKKWQNDLESAKAELFRRSAFERGISANSKPPALSGGDLTAAKKRVAAEEQRIRITFRGTNQAAAAQFLRTVPDEAQETMLVLAAMLITGSYAMWSVRYAAPVVAIVAVAAAIATAVGAAAPLAVLFILTTLRSPSLISRVGTKLVSELKKGCRGAAGSPTALPHRTARKRKRGEAAEKLQCIVEALLRALRHRDISTLATKANNTATSLKAKTEVNSLLGTSWTGTNRKLVEGATGMAEMVLKYAQFPMYSAEKGAYRCGEALPDSARTTSYMQHASGLYTRADLADSVQEVRQLGIIDDSRTYPLVWGCRVLCAASGSKQTLARPGRAFQKMGSGVEEGGAVLDLGSCGAWKFVWYLYMAVCFLVYELALPAAGVAGLPVRSEERLGVVLDHIRKMTIGDVECMLCCCSAVSERRFGPGTHQLPPSNATEAVALAMLWLKDPQVSSLKWRKRIKCVLVENGWCGQAESSLPTETGGVGAAVYYNVDKSLLVLRALHLTLLESYRGSAESAVAVSGIVVGSSHGR